MSDATVGARGARPGGAGGRLPAVAVGAAVVLHLVVGFFTITGIGLVGVPVWAVAVLVALWAVAAVLLYLLARRSPLVTPLVPLVNALLLWGLIAVGEGWLGWTS